MHSAISPASIFRPGDCRDTGSMVLHDRIEESQRHMVKQLLLLLTSTLLLGAGAAWSGPLEDGEAAYRRGDHARAAQLFRPLATGGNARAQAVIGFMHYNGQGVAQDYAEAVRWYRLAAAQGLAIAQSNLGAAYVEGKGAPQDYTEAVKLFRLAAAQGHAPAQSNLGARYAKGQGVAQDYVRAYMWFSLAALSDATDATNNRDLTAQRMTPQQIAEAKKMAQECRQRNFKGCD